MESLKPSNNFATHKSDMIPSCHVGCVLSNTLLYTSALSSWSLEIRVWSSKIQVCRTERRLGWRNLAHYSLARKQEPLTAVQSCIQHLPSSWHIRSSDFYSVHINFPCHITLNWRYIGSTKNTSLTHKRQPTRIGKGNDIQHEGDRSNLDFKFRCHFRVGDNLLYLAQ